MVGDFHFSESLSGNIVKGILIGYRNYLNERLEKKQKMKISSAYAWVKGNHIEDAVAKQCELNGIEFKQSKAGYTWGYLQFINNKEKVLFIIKNTSSLKKVADTAKFRHTDNNHYLNELSKINTNIGILGDSDLEKNQTVQLSFFGPELLFIDDDNVVNELKELKEKFTRFLIVTYATDIGNMISEINLILPEPGLEKFHLIENWTHLIPQTGVEFSHDMLSVISGEHEPDKQITYGDYGIEVPEKGQINQGK